MFHLVFVEMVVFFIKDRLLGYLLNNDHIEIYQCRTCVI